MTEEFDQESELMESTSADYVRSEMALEERDANRPDGLPEKFWDVSTGSVRTDSLLKSYLQLEKRFGEPDVERAPASAEEYEISTEGSYVSVDPGLNEKLHDAGFTQTQAQMVYDLAGEYLFPLAGELASELDAQNQVDRLAQTFGGNDQWQEIAAQLSEWGRSNFPSEVFEALASTYDGVVAMHRLMEKEEPDLIGNAPGTPGVTEETLKELMRDPRYWRDQDPSIVRKVQRGYEALFPG